MLHIHLEFSLEIPFWWKLSFTKNFGLAQTANKRLCQTDSTFTLMIITEDSSIQWKNLSWAQMWHALHQVRSTVRSMLVFFLQHCALWINSPGSQSAWEFYSDRFLALLASVSFLWLHLLLQTEIQVKGLLIWHSAEDSACCCSCTSASGVNGTSREQSKNSRNSDSGPEVYSKTSLKLIMAKILSSMGYFVCF